MLKNVPDGLIRTPNELQPAVLIKHVHIIRIYVVYANVKCATLLRNCILVKMISVYFRDPDATCWRLQSI